MLKQVTQILEKIKKSVEAGIKYPCQIRVRLEERGVEITVWSLLNTRQHHYYSGFFIFNDINVGDDTLLVQFVYEACRFFKMKIAR